MSVSLYVKLKELESLGAIETWKDPKNTSPSYSGSYRYQGSPVKIVGGVVDPEDKLLRDLLHKDDKVFTTPHDVAWCPAKNALLAYAPTTVEAFKTKEELLAPPEIEEVD